MRLMISTTPQNTVTWTLIRHLDKTSSADLEIQRLKNTDNTGWGPLSVQAMCDETRGIGIPGGNGAMNLGDLMDLTPKELMSKVMLEEKVFETWYSGRTVLLGDAAKLAMHDAVALANLIYTLPSSPLSIEDTTTLFSTYWTERYPAALEELQSSQLLNKTRERGLFLAQFKPEVIDPRLRTTNQIQPSEFCDYVAEVCYFKVERGYYGNKSRAVLVLTDYTEHPQLPFQDSEGRPIGKAAIITTLWDEHCDTAQTFDIKQGDIIYLKNLRPKINSKGNIELNMNGYRQGSGFRQIDPIQKLEPDHLFSAELRIRKHKYEQYLAAKQAEEERYEEGSIEPSPTPQRALTVRPTKQEPGTVTSQQPPQLQPAPRFASESTALPSPAPPQPHQFPRYPTFSVKASSSATSETRSPSRAFQSEAHTPFERENSPLVPVKSEPNREASLYTESPASPVETSPTGEVKFEYSFKLNLMDELDQTFTVDVDDEHGTMLLGFAAEDLVKEDDILTLVIGTLARIGVSNVAEQAKEIYFDFCVRQNFLCPKNRNEPRGDRQKRIGSRDPSRVAKRYATGSLHPSEYGSIKQSPKPPIKEAAEDELVKDEEDEEEETDNAPLTWSLVFTEIVKTEWK
ncbi:hypothetical protein KI688_005889 [Linnemannia hyalina]|uniref:Protection of telomeres protein 1 ssDNA-binding domain-containing protein n=1 Tax=Linnemannia hyalina TaxID=64524 RepID=A0A9P7Y2N8_9FUNG|nr:hypothetical protein KI688_005889 [Linnemannia hyalina]